MAEDLITQVTPSQVNSFYNTNFSEFQSLSLILPSHDDSHRDTFGINSPRETTPDNDTLMTTLNPETEVLTAPWRPNELLPPLKAARKGKKCLILDLDETLVHSSFVPTALYDITLNVDIEGIMRTIYVAKRPHVDEFLRCCGELFEVVVFTASLAKYADPLLDKLDLHKVIDHRLYRESCTSYGGIFVKDLFRMGRPLTHVLIIDNSPHSYIFNPENALPCKSWFDDSSDTELMELLEVLKRLADPNVDNIIQELKRVKNNEEANGYDEVIVDRTTAQESVSESENEEVTGSVESDNEGESYGDGQNGQWKAIN